MRHIFRKIKHYFRKNKTEIKESVKESMMDAVMIWGPIALWKLSKIVFKE